MLSDVGDGCLRAAFHEVIIKRHHHQSTVSSLEIEFLFTALKIIANNRQSNYPFQFVAFERCGNLYGKHRTRYETGNFENPAARKTKREFP